jgi:hypothetical protein
LIKEGFCRRGYNITPNRHSSEYPQNTVYGTPPRQTFAVEIIQTLQRRDASEMWRPLCCNKPLHHCKPRIPDQGNLAIALVQFCKKLNHIITIPATFAGMRSGIEVRVGNIYIGEISRGCKWRRSKGGKKLKVWKER